MLASHINATCTIIISNTCLQNLNKKERFQSFANSYLTPKLEYNRPNESSTFSLKVLNESILTRLHRKSIKAVASGLQRVTMNTYREFTTNLNPILKDLKPFDKTKNISSGKKKVIHWKEPLVEVFYFFSSDLPQEFAFNGDRPTSGFEDRDRSTPAQMQKKNNITHCACAGLEALNGDRSYDSRKRYEERKTNAFGGLYTHHEEPQDMSPKLDQNCVLQNDFEPKRFVSFEKRRKIFREHLLQLEGEWV